MFYCIMQCIRDVLLNRTRRCRWGTVQYWVRVCVITLWCNTMLLSTLCLWESCSFSNYWEALCLLRWDFTSYSYFYNDCSFAWWTCCVREWGPCFSGWSFVFSRVLCVPPRGSMRIFSRRFFVVPWNFLTQRQQLASWTDSPKTWMKVGPDGGLDCSIIIR